MKRRERPQWPRSRRAGGGSDLLSLGELFRQRFLVRPFAGRNHVVRIDADVWPTPCVDAHPLSRTQRVTLTGEQETRVLHDALQLREHFTRDEILADQTIPPGVLAIADEVIE